MALTDILADGSKPQAYVAEFKGIKEKNFAMMLDAQHRGWLTRTLPILLEAEFRLFRCQLVLKASEISKAINSIKQHDPGNWTYINGELAKQRQGYALSLTKVNVDGPRSVLRRYKSVWVQVTSSTLLFSA